MNPVQLPEGWGSIYAGPKQDQDSLMETELVQTTDPHHPPHLKTRVSVVEQVYYQDPENGIREFGGNPSSRWIESEEDPYIRRVSVGGEWQQLDSGWLLQSGASLLLLRNEEGKFTQTVPTPEERAEARDRVIEIGVAAGGYVAVFSEVHPGEPSLRLRPYALDRLHLRCRNGQKAKVTVILIPK